MENTLKYYILWADGGRGEEYFDFTPYVSFDEAAAEILRMRQSAQIFCADSALTRVANYNYDGHTQRLVSQAADDTRHS